MINDEKHLVFKTLNILFYQSRMCIPKKLACFICYKLVS